MALAQIAEGRNFQCTSYLGGFWAGAKAPWLDTGCIAHFKKVSPSVIPLLNDSSVGTF